MGKILCVAEKPSIAKAVSQHMGGQVRGVSQVPYTAVFLPVSLRPPRSVPYDSLCILVTARSTFLYTPLHVMFCSTPVVRR